MSCTKGAGLCRAEDEYRGKESTSTSTAGAWTYTCQGAPEETGNVSRAEGDTHHVEDDNTYCTRDDDGGKRGNVIAFLGRLHF